MGRKQERGTNVGKRITVMIILMIVAVLGMTGCENARKDTSESTSLTKNPKDGMLSYSKNDMGILYDYYQSYDGKWHAENKEYGYRIVLTGKTPNAAKESKFVVLSNDKNISFERVAWSMLSSNSSDWLDQKIALIVEMY